MILNTLNSPKLTAPKPQLNDLDSGKIAGPNYEISSLNPFTNPSN